MKRVLAILAIAAAGLVAACSQGGSTSSNGIESAPAVSIEAPSVGASAPAESMPAESAPSS
jgi:hypothetical protein